MEVVIHLHCRRPSTGTQALNGALPGELPIRRGATGRAAKTSLNVTDDLIRPTKRAAHIHADDHVVVTRRLVEVHRIEGADRLHLAWRETEHLRHLGHSLDRQEPEFVLHGPQARQDGAAWVRVAIAQRRDLLAGSGSQRHYRVSAIA